MTTRAMTFYGTTIGKKVVMATTGFIVVGWVILHMLGHLGAFAGRDKYNEYAGFLANNPPLLWGQRLVLLGALVLHIHAALSLWSLSSEARPRAYYQRKNLATNAAALTMRYGGIALLTFILYHVLTLTVGVGNAFVFVHGDVYNNLTQALANPIIAILYIVAMGVLGMHLYHGIWSLTQTLGLDHPKYNGLRSGIAAGLTVIIVLGFISVPVSVLTGNLQPVDPVVSDADAEAAE